MQPFKRPRLQTRQESTDSNGNLTTRLDALTRTASITATGSTSSGTSGSSSRNSSRLSDLRSPSVARVERTLLELPRVTQPLRKPVRFRKQVGTDEDIEWTFKQVFHKQHYKGRQEDIMKASLQGSDIVVIAPTGMGKSLCFQVPAVAEKHGLTLVVSPLLSLMQDQIAALRQLNVPCAMLSSKTSQEEQKEILQDMTSGHPKNRLLYITPERLSSAPFCKKLKILHKQQEFNRLVIDEAHCISEWGHDFRPEYAKLGNFRVEFPKVPIMALTASATPKVQEDIAVELGLEPDLLFKVIHPFNRPNLFYEVRYYSEQDEPFYRQNDILSFVQKMASRGGSDRPCAGIVYCRAKRTCDDLAAFLRGKGIFAAPYHRGLKDHEADSNQQKWVNNDELAGKGLPRVDCVVATIAFGMGIDKSNCRYVVHYDVPKSFEGYYQETGRAGRDGHAARCVLYYSAEDKLRIKELVRKTHTSRQRRAERENALMPSQRAPNSIDALLSYCENVKVCRHVTICRYFGEKATEADTKRYCDRLCDVCRDPKRTRRRREQGLVTLDFAATQALEQEVEEPDLDDFYEIPAHQAGQGDLEAVDEADDEQSDGETGADTVKGGPRAKLEGFRSAASELKGQSDAVQNGDPGSPSTSDSEVDRYEPEVLELSDDVSDGDSQVVPVQLKTLFAPASSPPAMQQSVNTVNIASPVVAPAPAVPTARTASPAPPVPPIDSDDEELPVLDDLPRVKSTVLKENVSNRSTSVVQVMGKLPPPNIIKKPDFETPFLDKTRNPNYRAPDSVKLPGDASSSVGSEPPKRFDLEPAITDKAIPVKMRKELVTYLVKHLQRALLSKHGVRSSDSEEAIWKSLGAAGTVHEKRRNIILAAALEIESDLFWTSLTGEGYRMFSAPLVLAARSIKSREGPLPPTDHDTQGFLVGALTRAVAALVPAANKRKRKARQQDEEQEEEDANGE